MPRKADKERRKYRRLVVEDKDVKCDMVIPSKAKLVNLSVGGASICLTRKLNIGDEYSLSIESSDSTLNLDGEVVWVEPMAPEGGANPAETLYKIGLRFKDIFSSKGEDLVYFIDQNACDNMRKLRLRGIRVKLRENDVVVDEKRKFNIKKISLGGVLIESTQAMDLDGRFSMGLELPEGAGAIEFVGRIASCIESAKKDTKAYDIGVEFIEMSEADKKKLNDFIEIIS